MTRKTLTRLLVLAAAGLMLSGCLTVGGSDTSPGRDAMEWRSDHQGA